MAVARAKTKGFTLIELGLVIAIMTIIATTLIKQQAQEARMLTAKAQGEQLKTIREGLYSYAMRNFTAVVSNTPVAGIANTRAPTVAELTALNYISGGLTNNAFYGANYSLTANPSPIACAMPNCNLLVEAHLTAPVVDPFSGNVDGPAVGEIIRTIGADGGASMSTPGTINGLNGAWNMTNPMGAVAGIVMARAGVGTQMDMASYLKRDGTLPMTGDLDMGAQSLYNLAVATQGNACVTAGEVATDTNGAVLSCQGGTWMPQGSAYWKDPVNNAASLPACNAAAVGQSRVVMTPSVGAGPRAYTCNGATWQALAQDNNGNMTIAGTLTTGKTRIVDVVTNGAACSPNGLVARTNAGMLLSCQSGVWARASGGNDPRGQNGLLYAHRGRTITCTLGIWRAYAIVSASGIGHIQLHAASNNRLIATHPGPVWGVVGNQIVISAGAPGLRMTGFVGMSSGECVAYWPMN